VLAYLVLVWILEYWVLVSRLLVVTDIQVFLKEVTRLELRERLVLVLAYLGQWLV
jgi:hypothetical protein